MTSPLPWTSQFPATLKGVIDAAAWLETVAEAEGFPDELSFDIQLCVEELFTNVVRHGGGRWDEAEAAGSPSPVHVSIRVARADDVVTVVLEDNGTPFDVAAAPAKAAEGSLEDVRPEALGIKLIKTFSSGLTYGHVGGVNRTSLKFLWPRPAFSLQ